LVIVIGLMLAISLLSNELGIEQGLSIALFPMVILTMTIERMSIVWEERGPATAIKEFLGSLAVAVAGYFAMTEEHLVYLMFVFPELLLVVLSLCLVFGAYTGYRLSEIFRFKDLTKGQP
ncbi:MAG: 7TM domain-containing protein, partial [Gammaproteobacteria bacterium]